MTKDEAIKAAESFLEGCYGCWSGAKYFISNHQCEAIETLIEEAKKSE